MRNLSISKIKECNSTLITLLTMAEKVKIPKYIRLMKNLISCKMIYQITTFSENLKLGQTVHALKCNG